MIKIKRIYEPPSQSDGFRVLVDGLWPRGFAKDDAKIDLWMKEIAPSGELRKWFSHDPKKWERFKSRYKKELEKKSGLVKEIKKIEKENKVVTLLFATKDETHSNVHVLNEILRKRSQQS